jgi:hypothetical protein
MHPIPDEPVSSVTPSQSSSWTLQVSTGVVHPSIPQLVLVSSQSHWPFPQWSHDSDSAGFPLVVPHPLTSEQVRVRKWLHEQTDQPPHVQDGVQMGQS